MNKFNNKQSVQQEVILHLIEFQKSMSDLCKQTNDLKGSDFTLDEGGKAGSLLTESQVKFQELYTKPVQEQSFSLLASGRDPLGQNAAGKAPNMDKLLGCSSPEKEIPADPSAPTSSNGVRVLSELSGVTGSQPGKGRVQGGTGQAIRVVPEEVVFDGVPVSGSSTGSAGHIAVLQSSLLSSGHAPKKQKILLKNLMSQPVTLTLETSQSRAGQNLLSLNLFEISITPTQLSLQMLESAQLTVEVLPKKGSQVFAKLPSKIKECIFVKSEFSEQKIDVTIIPKQNTAQVEAADNDTGSNYTYTGNNDSMHSSSRYSMASRSRQAAGGRNNALERMRSLSKEIRDQRSRGSSLQKSQLVQGAMKSDGNEDRLMLPDANRAARAADRPLLPLGASQLAQSQLKTANARADPNLLLQQKDLAKTGKEQETLREHEDDKDDNRGHIQVHRYSAGRQGNNMTASFNQDDLKILERNQDQGTRAGITDHEITGKLVNPFYGQTQELDASPVPKPKHKFRLADLDNSRDAFLRNDLDESALDDGQDDIQRGNPTQDGELNLTDMTHTYTDVRDPNDQSLRLNQLEHSTPLGSQYTYSKTNNTQLGTAARVAGHHQEDQQNTSHLSNFEQTERIASLKNEIKGFQKIIDSQQMRIKEEIKKREEVEDAFNVSKMNNEATILNKIQVLLREEEPNLEELMSLSLRQERQKQQQKDQQVLHILKQKDQEISELTEAVEKARARIEVQDKEISAIQKENSVQKTEVEALLQELDAQKNGSNHEMRERMEEQEREIAQLQQLQNEAMETQRQLEDTIEQLSQQVEQRDHSIGEHVQEKASLENKIEQLRRALQQQDANLDDDLKAEENRILVKELERVEKENEELVKRNREMAEQFRAQTAVLQEKLNQSYQDIQRLASEKSQEKVAEAEERRDRKVGAAQDQNSQTDLDFMTIDQVFQVAQKSLATDGPEQSRDPSPENGVQHHTSLDNLEHYLKSASFASPPQIVTDEMGGLQRSRQAAEGQLPTDLVTSDRRAAGLPEQIVRLEYTVHRQKEELKQVRAELLQKKEEVETMAKVSTRQDGLTYEDLLKLNEYLKRQNQKLQVRAIEVRDVEDLGQVPILGYGGESKEEVFNPYKTTLDDPDNAADAPAGLKATKPRSRLKNYDAFHIDQIIQQNFELKQQLVREGSRLKEDEPQSNSALSYQLKQRDLLIKQLRDQLEQCESSFRDEIERVSANQREQYEKLAKLLRQYGRNQVPEHTLSDGGSIATQNFEKELKIAISKLQVQYDQFFESKLQRQSKEQLEFLENETLCQQHNALKQASKTILQYKKETYELQMKLIQVDCYQNAAVINRILANRHHFLLFQMKNLQSQICQKNEDLLAQKQQIVDFYESIIAGYEKSAHEYQALLGKMAEQDRLISQQQLEKEKIEMQATSREVEMRHLRASIEKQAEIEYDKRQKLRDERIKTYFDTQVMKFLIQHNSQSVEMNATGQRSTADQDMIELTRQFCNLQIELDHEKQRIAQLTAESDGNAKIIEEQRQMIEKLTGDIRKSDQLRHGEALKYHRDGGIKLLAESEMLKQMRDDNAALQRALAQRTTEVDELRMGQIGQQFQSCFWRFDEVLQGIEKDLQMGRDLDGLEIVGTNTLPNFGGPLVNQEMRAQVESLQKQMIDLRTQQLLEIEEVKMNCEVELMEEKRRLKKQEHLLENKFEPSGASQSPLEMLDQSQRLQEKNSGLEGQVESLRTELAIVEKKLEEERLQQCHLKDEIRAYKEAMLDLRKELCEPMVQRREATERHNARVLEDEQLSQEFQFHQSNFNAVGALPGTGTNASQVGLSQTQLPKPKEKQTKAGGVRQSKRSSTTIATKQAAMKDKRASADLMDQSSVMTADQQAFSGNPLITNRSMTPDCFTQPPSARAGEQGPPYFTFTPPQIISQLMAAKLNEKQLLMQMDRCVQKENQAKLEVRKVLVEQAQRQGTDKEIIERQLTEERIKRHDLEAKLRDLEIKFLREGGSRDGYFLGAAAEEDARRTAHDLPNRDYTLMVNCLLHLINKTATEPQQERQAATTDRDILRVAQQDSVYKLIIMQLSRKMQQLHGQGDSQVQIDQYMPVGERNQKIWYLELLESQLTSAEAVVNKLFDFVKRLQVDVQGSLTSAAQIKATSMDLATNTREASDEVKLLKQMAQLVRSDIESLGTNHAVKASQQLPMETMRSTAQGNPFLEQTAQVQPMLAAHAGGNLIELQNQLSITMQVKMSLERELARLRQELIDTKSQCREEVEVLSTSNQKMEVQLQKLEQELPKCKIEKKKLEKELNSLKSKHKHVQDQSKEEIQSKEQENSALAKNQSLTSKNLQRLQKDMLEWRKTTDENLRMKDEKIAEQQKKAQKGEKELQKLKAENQMLRRNQKEWLGSTTRQMEDQRNDVQEKLRKIEAEQEQKASDWAQQKEEMAEKIEELEAALQEKKGEGLLAKHLRADPPADETMESVAQHLPDSKELSDILVKNKKLKKKLQQKDDKQKQLEQKLAYVDEEMKKLEKINDKLKADLEAQEEKFGRKEIEMKTMEQTIRQLELEKQMLQAEKRNHIQASDTTSQQIQEELDALRASFAQLKVEKELLVKDVENSRTLESQWRHTVEQLKRDIEHMQSRIGMQQDEQSRRTIDLEAKEEQMSVQIKLLKNEVAALKQENKALLEQVQAAEQVAQEKEQKLRMAQMKSEEASRLQQEMQQRFKETESLTGQMEEQMRVQEVTRSQVLEELSAKIEEIKESRQSLSDLYEGQLEILKQKLVQTELQVQSLKEPKMSKDIKERVEKDVDLQFTLSQRESLIKQIKKELQSSKSQNAKLKTKNTDLKKLVDKLEKQQQEVPKPGHRQKRDSSWNSGSISTKEDRLRPKESSFADQTTSQEALAPELLQKLTQFNDLHEKLVNSQAFAAKTESYNMVLLKQTAQQEQEIQDLRAELDGLLQKDTNDRKLQKLAQSQTETIKSLRQENRSIELELEQLKQTWIPPDKQRADTQALEELQAATKQQKEEANRKRDLIQNLKTQKEALEKENKDLQEKLKQSNSKLQKQEKQARSQAQQQVNQKQMKQDFEQMKRNNAELHADLQLQIEKAKQMKGELARKEQMLKDLRGAGNERSSQYPQNNSRLGAASEEASELSQLVEDQKKKLREQKQKHKLDTDIKENQIRSLRQKLEQYEDLIKELKGDNEAIRQESMDMPLQVQHTFEKQQKKDKMKIKKYEQVLRKALEALRALCQILWSQAEKKGPSASQTKSAASSGQGLLNAGAGKEKDVEEYKSLYKDSVAILGVSLDELEEFMNPEKPTKDEKTSVRALLQKLEQIQSDPDEGALSLAVSQKAASSDEAGGKPGLQLLEDIDFLEAYCTKVLEDLIS